MKARFVTAAVALASLAAIVAAGAAPFQNW